MYSIAIGILLPACFVTIHAVGSPQGSKSVIKNGQDTIQGQPALKPDTGGARPFYIYRDAKSPDNHYRPTGYMGDCGDISIDEAYRRKPHSGKTCIKIIYLAQGKGPNECPENPPCRWGGVYWQQPAENWGRIAAWAGEGYDLSAYTRLVFWARSDRPCIIEFRFAGLNEPYGDSQTTPKGFFASLTEKWGEYSMDLKDCNLKHIIGGFCWRSSWEVNPRGAIFYLDDIRFDNLPVR